MIHYVFYREHITANESGNREVAIREEVIFLTLLHCISKHNLNLSCCWNETNIII